jgi:hypothetical protein
MHWRLPATLHAQSCPNHHPPTKFPPERGSALGTADDDAPYGALLSWRRQMGAVVLHIERLERMVLLPTGELLVIRLIDRF